VYEGFMANLCDHMLTCKAGYKRSRHLQAYRTWYRGKGEQTNRNLDRNPDRILWKLRNDQKEM